MITLSRTDSLEHAQEPDGLLFVDDDRLLTWSRHDDADVSLLLLWNLSPVELRWAVTEQGFRGLSPESLCLRRDVLFVNARHDIYLRRLATGKYEETLRLHEIGDAPLVRTPAVFSPDGEQVAVGAHDQQRGDHVQVLDSRVGRVRATLILRGEGPLTALAWLTPDVVLTSQGRAPAVAERVDVWRPEGERLLATIEEPGGAFFACSPSGRLLLWRSAEWEPSGAGQASIWQLAGGVCGVEPRLVARVPDARRCDGAQPPVFSTDGALVVLPGIEPSADPESAAVVVRAIDTTSLLEVSVAPGPGDLLAVALSADGRLLATVSGSRHLHLGLGKVGRTLRLWSLPDGNRLASARLDDPGDPVGTSNWRLAISPGGKRLALAAGDQVLVWHLR